MEDAAIQAASPLRKLILAYRLELAEILIGWTLDVFPDGEERTAFAKAALLYFNQVWPHAVPARYRGGSK